MTVHLLLVNSKLAFLFFSLLMLFATLITCNPAAVCGYT